MFGWQWLFQRSPLHFKVVIVIFGILQYYFQFVKNRRTCTIPDVAKRSRLIPVIAWRARVRRREPEVQNIDAKPIFCTVIWIRKEPILCAINSCCICNYVDAFNLSCIPPYTRTSFRKSFFNCKNKNNLF